jgi:glycosyltransferase involved in cell wall biosynthesis
MEAAEWIIRTLAPALAQRMNDVRILMTGAGKQPAATHPVVTLTGFVPDLFEYIHASDVFIAPIEMPSGRLTKAFDSLSCGISTVVLASATNGIPELVDGENAMIAKDREEFIEKTVYLLENPDVAREIGLRGRKMLEEYYDWNFWEERLNSALQSCLVNKEKG